MTRISALLVGVIMVGCATDTDSRHELAFCNVPDLVDGMPDAEFSCEAACVGVTRAQASAGDTCHSAKLDSTIGAVGATCHVLHSSDGAAGCCAIVDGKAQDPRLPQADSSDTKTYGWEFFECD